MGILQEMLLLALSLLMGILQKCADTCSIVFAHGNITEDGTCSFVFAHGNITEDGTCSIVFAHGNITETHTQVPFQ